MKWRVPSLCLLTITLGCTMFNNSSSSFSTIDTDQVHPKNKRIYRSITLPNKLDVLLISDPNMNKSAAAMDVRVGSLEDPMDQQGIAHFLEHVLFLGTSKYPDVDAYHQYLKHYQGGSNAFTDRENTNYFLDVSHEGFEGALDRFAQFFISPSFDKDFVAREREAVNSEHEKNVKNDGWRTYQLLNFLHKEGHPKRKFATGDKKTLANTTREELIEFYNKHYSANMMKLTVMSNKSLDELENLVKKDFSDVPNKDLKPNTYDSQIFDPKDLPRLITFVPIKNSDKITLIFPTPTEDPYWRSKPSQLIGHILGYEGKGSLLSFLKKEDLVTSLSAGLVNSSHAGMLNVEMKLTKKGLKEYERVLEILFSYVHMMKQKGLPSYIYDEVKMMADINYIYREAAEGGQVASHYAGSMHDHPGELIDKNEYLFHTYSPKDYELFLNCIDEKKMTVFLNSQDIKQETLNLIEPQYKNRFHSEGFTAEQMERFSKPKTFANLDLPKENPFIPHKLVLASSEDKTAPQKLLDNEFGTFWFQQDDQFHLPKAFGRIELVTPKTGRNPQEAAISLLYTSAFNESHNEWFYDLHLAGLNFSALRSDQGISIDFAGYTENIPMLLEEGIKKLTDLTLTETTFEALKAELKRSISNASFDQAYNQAMYELKYISDPTAFHRMDLYDPEHKIDLISSVSLDQIKAYAKDLYKEIGMRAMVFGSIETETVKNSIQSIPRLLGAKALPKDKYLRSHRIKLKEGQRFTRLLNNKTNNNSFAMSLHFGERNFETNAVIRLGMSILQSEFFTELRTKQQLGYMVHMGNDFHDKFLGILFLIQSSEFDNHKIAESVQHFFSHAISSLEKISDQDFENIKSSVINELRDKEKNMADKMGILFAEAYNYDETFNYKYQLSLVAEKITKQDMIDAFSKKFSDKNRSSISIYLNKDKITVKPFDKLKETIISDVRSFKQNTPSY